MQKIRNTGVVGLLAFVLAIMLSGVATAGGEVNIVGTISEDNQLVDDSGTIYDVADNELGEEVMEHAGKKISVKGTVMESEGTKMITITSYELVE